jgi:hypothetical protein
MLENSLPEFEIFFSDLFKAFLYFSSRKYFTDAEALCFLFIEKYKSKIKLYISSKDEPLKNTILVSLILTKGLQDFIQISKLTQNRIWHKNNQATEKIWLLMWDSKDRLEFARKFFYNEALETILNNLYELENFFRDEFGDGIYTSPGIIFDNISCTICNRDTRSCGHISGRIYDGQICWYSPVGVQADHLAIVKIPKDPRCRIWPWNVQDNPDGEGLKASAIILTSFSLDNFLYE